MAKKKKSYGRRAARGEGSIRHRADGRWDYRYKDNDGELQTAYAYSEAEILEKKTAIRAALQEGSYVTPSAYTVSTWADYFFSELYLQQNNNTRACVYSHIKNHIQPFFKDMKLQDAGKEDVQRFHKRLKSYGGIKELPSKKYYIESIDNSHYLALPKHNKKRHIKPGRQVMDMLREIKARQISARLRTGLGDAFNPHGFVFVNDIGQHLTSTTVLPHFRKVLAAIGAPKEMRIHDLRHTYVYNALQSGLTYDQISENLGHKSVDFTKSQYGHFPELLHEDSGQKMDAFSAKVEEQRAARKKKARGTS